MNGNYLIGCKRGTISTILRVNECIIMIYPTVSYRNYLLGRKLGTIFNYLRVANVKQFYMLR